MTTYTSEGTSSTLASSVAQITITIYDFTYHAYATSIDPPELPATTYTYNYALGVVASETGSNGAATTITAEYDAFGRLTKIIKPGDTTSSPTTRITYTDASNHPWAQLGQRLSGSTYTVVRKFYDGQGRLVQTRTLGAALENGTRDIIVNTWYDAYGNIIEQSVPYDVSRGAANGRRTQAAPPL